VLHLPEVRPPARDRHEDFALPGLLDDLNHLRFQLLKVLLDQFQFRNQLLLLDLEATQASRVFGSDTLGCDSLQFHEFGIRDATSATSCFSTFPKCGNGQLGRGREAKASSECCRQVRVAQKVRKLREEFIADGRELVFALCARPRQFIMMSYHSAELGGRFRRRNQATHRLKRIAHLDPFLQLVVEHVRQTEGIAFVIAQDFQALVNDPNEANKPAEGYCQLSERKEELS